MPTIKLYGKRSGIRTFTIKQPKKATERTQSELPNPDQTKHHRKASFAAASRLRPHLQKAGITNDALWSWIKNRYSVESRTELTLIEWAKTSAEFNAALRDSQMLQILIQRIKGD